jgi:hypothetical protein
MNRPRYRQLLAFPIALLLPSIAIGWLGWQVIVQQQKLEREQGERDRQRIAAEIGADIRDRLNRIKTQVIAEAPAAARGYSDPAVALVAWAEGGQLVLPWGSPEPKPELFRRASEDLAKIEEDVTRAVYGRKQPGQAAETLRAEIQKPRWP